MSLLETDLGAGRAWTRVGDCYAVTKKPRGLDRSAFPEIPFAAMDAIPQGGGYLPDFTMRTPESIVSGTYFERGDILVAKITPSFENGKQALVHALPSPFGYATTEVIPLHPRDTCHDPRLLFFYLLHPDVRDHVAERMEGSTGRQRVPENVLLDLPIPSMTIEDQRVVADMLETIQRALAVESQCEKIARDLKRAAMRTLFTRGLRGEAQRETEIGLVPESWRVVSLESLGRIGSGTTPNRKDPDFWNEGTIPWITSGRMYEREITGAKERVTAHAIQESSLPLLKPGAVLMAIVGQGKTLGHCALLRVEATISRHVGYIQPDIDVVVPQFLRGYLEGKYEHLRQLASGNGSTRAALTAGLLRSVPISLPPTLHEQREIVSVLDAIDRKIDLHRRKRAVLDALFKALLHKLMTGEIRVADLDLSVLTLGGMHHLLQADAA